MPEIRKYDPTTPGGSDRFDCPVCGVPMAYVFPSSVKDQKVDALLWRLQECRNERCRENPRIDVVTSKNVIVTNRNVAGQIGEPYITVDGFRYENLYAYFVSVGALKPLPGFHAWD